MLVSDSASSSGGSIGRARSSGGSVSISISIS